MNLVPDPILIALLWMPFAVALVALKVILVDPVREWLEGRDHAIAGSRHEASHLIEKAEAATADLEMRLKDARDRAGTIRAEHRERGQETERNLLADARAKADAELATALSSIHAEALDARGSLGDQARALSNDIAGRVLGRTIGGVQ